MRIGYKPLPTQELHQTIVSSSQNSFEWSFNALADLCGTQRGEVFEGIVDDLDSTENGEPSEESHRSSNHTQGGLQVNSRKVKAHNLPTL